jgi:transcriptional regulator with XRE-family HTH domain
MSANEDKNTTYPYLSLGRLLKRLRERRLESLAEVSGAVEIDTMQLEAIEKGKRLPSEDILLLLINHFAIKDAEASKLWELAGYDQPGAEPVTLPTADDPQMMKQALIVMPMDTRIVYTDTVHVMVNNYGVVMNFMQGGGSNSQPLSIARIGMSKEHAKSVLELLQRTLAQSEPKSLPARSQHKNKKQS